MNTVREITNERVGKRHTEEEIIALNAEAKKDNPASNVRFSSFYRIPVLSIAQAASCGAGNGLYGVEEEFTDFLFLDSNIFTRWDDMRKPFGIHIDGDSMEGAGLTEGSIAVINPAEETISGDAALVVWNDNWFIKWVVYMPNGDVELRSANPAYSPIKVEREYAENPDWFKIVGKVVDIVYKRRPKRAF
ncbi:MAG: S24 family peptidase [Synergistaceae bacterium]|nr:S24 family peptidase [Synergistaceae bacterium]